MQGYLTQSWELQKEKQKQQSRGFVLAVPPEIKRAETPGGGTEQRKVTVATSNTYSVPLSRWRPPIAAHRVPVSALYALDPSSRASGKGLEVENTDAETDTQTF